MQRLYRKQIDMRQQPDDGILRQPADQHFREERRQRNKDQAPNHTTETVEAPT